MSNDVFFLGAGFSKAINNKYPTLKDLSKEIRDNYGAITIATKDIKVANNLNNGLYNLPDALTEYSLPDMRTDLIFYHRSQYLMSLGIDMYKVLQPNLHQTKYEPSLDSSMMTKTDPVCTLDFCNNKMLLPKFLLQS